MLRAAVIAMLPMLFCLTAGAQSHSREPIAAGTPLSRSGVYLEPFAGLQRLELVALTDQVLARHPTIASAAAGYRAEASQIAQAAAMPDPMFDYMMAPATIDSDVLDFAYILQGRQNLPWPGKRQLRGQVARFEARAAYQDVSTARLLLTQATKEAFYEYFAAAALLRLNGENLRALQAFRDIAIRRYESNLVSQQDVLQADVELATLAQRRLERERMRRVAAARINTLLLVSPDSALPPPPDSLPSPPSLPPAAALRQLALDSRPEIAAIASQLQAQQSSLALANQEFKPDVEMIGRFDKMWQNEDAEMQSQFGFTSNIPLYKQKRYAAVREASARIAQQRADWANQAAQVQFEVQQAYEQVLESLQTVELYDSRILPAAEANVRSAEAGYRSGQVDFLRLVSAERGLIELSERRIEAVAALHIRLAALERAMGSAIPTFRRG